MLPDWLDPVFDAPGMAAADRWTIEREGVAGLDLMETAGRGLADRAVEMAGAGPVAIVCGKGNNGGDGLVAARRLAELGIETAVFLAAAAGDLGPDARVQMERLPGNVPVEPVEALVDLAPGRFGLAVDALLGTGFEGRPHGPVATAIEWLNNSGCRILACDLPSGVNGSTGEAELAVAADATVTFHGLKLGHVVNPGRELSGRVEVFDIGILPDSPPARFGAIRETVLEGLPGRGPGSSKFSSGRVDLIGGSAGLTGAVSLAAVAAIRSGAGYATALVPAGLEPVLAGQLTEVMTVGIGDGAVAHGAGSVPAILERCRSADSVVLGSGFGRDDGQRQVIRELAAAIEAPLVLDADGLSLLGTDLGPISARTAPTVLTPHAGEMGRLLGRSSAEVQAHRLDSAWRLARETDAVVVLKGGDTLIAAGDRLAVNRLSAPGLATAGTGDVLAGVIGALLARGLDPFRAAAAGVYAHTRAGVLAAATAGSTEGVIASDVIAGLPEALLPGDRKVK